MISFPPLEKEDGTEGPMVIEAEVGGHLVHRMYVDGGASSEILYEHCFNQLSPEIRNQMVPATTYLVGFSGEIIWPLGIAACKNRRRGTLNFRMDELHGCKIAFSIQQNNRKAMCKENQSNPVHSPQNVEVPRPRTQQPVVDQDAEEKIQVAIHPEYPEQTIAIGSTLTKEGQKKRCGLLRQNLDIFAWKPADMTRVPRHIAKHRLNFCEGCFPVRQKKRGQASERNKAICEEGEKLVNAGIMKEVHYNSWLSNPVMVKKHDNSWRMCVDFKDLNKACPKDGYPLPEID
ncbi:hypothetical protein Tco_0359525 [Tanacetum coccineum]